MHYHKHRLIVPFLAPGLLLYATFVLWPYAQAFYIAFTSWTGVTSEKPFTGLDNFRKLADDSLFWNALKHNGALLIVLPLCVISLAVLFSALITQGGSGTRGLPGSNVYRVLFFFPEVMSAAIIGVLFSFVYHPSLGLLNGFLGAIGLESLQRPWLGDAGVVLWAIAGVSVWAGVGFFMVLFIAAMQAIPPEYYEAARLDGAGRWRSFWGITLPLMRDQMQVALVFIGLGALDGFVLVQIMAEGGGPSRAADMVARYMYDTAFKQSQFGYATAIGVVLFALGLLLSLITIRLTQRERVEF